jgi:hypothetical protein
LGAGRFRHGRVVFGKQVRLTTENTKNHEGFTEKAKMALRATQAWARRKLGCVGHDAGVTAQVNLLAGRDQAAA